MRVRLVSVVVAMFLATTAAGCDGGSSPDTAAARTSAPSSPDTPAVRASTPPRPGTSAGHASAASNTAKICDTLVNWAARGLTDVKDPVTAKFVKLIEDGGTGLSTTQKVEIRQAYYRKQEGTLRSLAATATDPHVGTLLGNFAESWGALARDTSDNGPDRIQPGRGPLDTACPGIEHRIDSVSEAGN